MVILAQLGNGWKRIQDDEFSVGFVASMSFPQRLWGLRVPPLLASPCTATGQHLQGGLMPRN